VFVPLSCFPSSAWTLVIEFWHTPIITATRIHQEHLHHISVIDLSGEERETLSSISLFFFPSLCTHENFYYILNFFWPVKYMFSFTLVLWLWTLLLGFMLTQPPNSWFIECPADTIVTATARSRLRRASSRPLLRTLRQMLLPYAMVWIWFDVSPEGWCVGNLVPVW
jgi:hypothetical protein